MTLLDTYRGHRLFAQDHISAIYHYRFIDQYRKIVGHSRPLNRTLHAAVVVFKDGRVFSCTIRNSNHPYHRKIWRERAIGGALKQAATAVQAGDYRGLRVDLNEFSTPRELDQWLRGRLVRTIL